MKQHHLSSEKLLYLTIHHNYTLLYIVRVPKKKDNIAFKI